MKCSSAEETFDLAFYNGGTAVSSEFVKEAIVDQKGAVWALRVLRTLGKSASRRVLL